MLEQLGEIKKVDTTCNNDCENCIYYDPESNSCLVGGGGFGGILGGLLGGDEIDNDYKKIWLFKVMLG